MDLRSLSFLTITLLPFQSYWTWYDGKYNFYPMSYDNLSSVFQNVFKFYQQLTGEERGILLSSPVNTTQVIVRYRIYLQTDGWTDGRTWWNQYTPLQLRCRGYNVLNFISSLPVKRGGSLSFLGGTISKVLVMEIGWTDVESGGYILVSCAHSNTSVKIIIFSVISSPITLER
jgi:hypothetical protein